MSAGTWATAAPLLIALAFVAPAVGAAPSRPITNVASVSSTTSDPVATNNSSTAVVVASAAADLSVSVSAPPRALPAGDLVYSLLLHNAGPSDARDATLALTVPAGLSFVSGTGGCAGGFPCALGTLPAGSTRTVEGRFRLSARYSGPRALPAVATVSSTFAADAATANDSSGATSLAASIARDLDRDGHPDILWHHQTSGHLYAWLLDGTVTRAGGHLDPARVSDTRWQVRGLADFDGDGKTDVLWRHEATGELYAWFLDGQGRAARSAYLTPRSFPDTRWQIRGVDDFDGDGHADLLWHHQTTGELYLWFLEETTVVRGGYLTPRSFSDTRWQIRAVADFDGDGHPDVLWHHQTTGELYVWHLDGTTVTRGAHFTPSRFADTNWQIRAVADHDADGDLDVLWQNRASGDLYVWLMDETTAVSGAYLTPQRLADGQWQIVPR